MGKVLNRAVMAFVLQLFLGMFSGTYANEIEILVCDDIQKHQEIAYEYARTIVISSLEDDDVSYIASRELAQEAAADAIGVGCGYYKKSTVEFIDSDECVPFLKDWCLQIYLVTFTDIVGETQDGYVIPQDTYENIEGLSFSNSSFRIKVIVTEIVIESKKFLSDI